MTASIPPLIQRWADILASYARSPLHVLGLFVLGIVATAAVAYIVLYPLGALRFSGRNLPGPKPTSLLWGNQKDVWAKDTGVVQTEWFERYGKIVRYRYVLGQEHIAIIDPVALGYIFQNTDTFVKMYRSKRILEDILGRGLLTLDPVDHKRQRRVLNPAFSMAAIKTMVEDFFEEGYKLRDRLAAEANKVGEDDKKRPVVNVHHEISNTTMDIIGRCGFSQKNLSSDDSELGASYSGLLNARKEANILDFLQISYPLFKHLPTKATARIRAARIATDRIGHEIVADRKKALSVEGDEGRDMLSRLLRANMSPDLKPEHRMTDAEVMGQITTLMFAGHETTSTAMVWLLWRLALNPDIQARLRAELEGVDTDQPDFDNLNALPYLEAVTHEILRLDDPVALSYRRTAKDAVVPLSAPITAADGTLIDSLHVRAGTVFHTPIICINRSKDIWGPDADEFNPDRFARADTPAGPPVPGMYGNLLTFLSGPHNCIGYRFALAEIKVLTFVLVRAFQFSMPENPQRIVPVALVTMRPSIDGKIQMPLVLTPIEQDA